jgi:hypothetical protein
MKLNCLNFIILACCIIPLSLFANDDKSKKNKNERDTTILKLGESGKLARIRFSEDSLFTPEQMQEDLLFFYEKILATHPNPYYVFSKDSLDKKVQDILMNLDKPMNRREFWIKIATLHVCFDAHTSFVRIEEIYDYYVENSNPKMVDNLITLDSLGNLCFSFAYKDSLLAGKQIKSVNGISADKIVDVISTYYSHENRNTLSIRFSSHFFLLFVNIFGAVDSFCFEFIKNDDEIDIRTFYPVEEPSKNMTPSIEPKQQPNAKNIWGGKNFIKLSLYEEDSMAIIELNDFSPINLGKNFRENLEAIMDTVVKKNIKYLFIDISANGGGYDHHALEILNFIKTKKEKYYVSSGEIKTSPAYREAIERMATRKPTLFERLGKYYRGVFKSDIGSILQTDFNWEKSNSTVQYAQNVYLIQSTRATYSASVTLASVVKAYKLGIIVGEETGGLTSCYINPVAFATPNTSILFRCSMQKSTDVGGLDGRGVIPDVEYKINNPYNSFTLEQLKEMLKLVEEYTAQNNKY